MSNRIALFNRKEEIEEFFRVRLDDDPLFKASYNMAPGNEIFALLNEDGEVAARRLHWGLSGDGKKESRHTIDTEEALDGLRRGDYHRCVIPVSGYYKWKDAGKRSDFPFFIRMLHEPLMALAGIAAGKNKDSPEKCAIIRARANALLQPLDPYMPLQLNRELSGEWLLGDLPAAEVMEDASKLFLMTEMTVLRVGVKVNDLSEDSPDLIQPLPK